MPEAPHTIFLEACSTAVNIPPLPAGTHAWIITDGKAGDQNPCIGVAQAMGLAYTLKPVSKHKFWDLFAPHVLNPQQNPLTKGSAFAPPFPDIIIASGRRAVAVMREIKRLSPPTFCVFLKDPYTHNSGADVIWQPLHDTHVQPNALQSLLSPHHLHIQHASTLQEIKTLSILVGGNSRHTTWAPRDSTQFMALLRHHAAHPDVHLRITTSRRTPEALQHALLTLCEGMEHSCWVPDCGLPNPYVELLTQADALIVTADSINMLSEALAVGVPVYCFAPSMKAGRVRNSVAQLMAAGLVQPLTNALNFTPQTPLNVTPALALEIATRYCEVIDCRAHN